MGLWRAIFPQIHEQPSVSGALDGDIIDLEDDLVAPAETAHPEGLETNDLPKASSI